ncbi:aldehyde dehydrogenase family protein [Halalkalibacter alkalisediminis]|uniref:Aldehyde dehydrogenase family protein n=1 Tax=Halalkalibacter alkalisediminis TaxID=935616 RepID=A0ABV6NHW2_9BACI
MDKQLYMNGEMVRGEGNVRRILNPSSESTVATVYEASVKQVEMAIQAARDAFNDSSWKEDIEERTNFLLRIADTLAERREEFAVLETENTGKPIREARLDVEDSVNCLRYYAKLVKDQQIEETDQWDGSTSRIKNVPYGVTALIVPWNFPLLLGIWKIAPALAAGNTIVFKPSELTPLTMIKLAELMKKCALPDGVFNLVIGDGQTVGQTLVTSEEVDKISFTGGTKTGRTINEQCARTFKRVSLELGGKSPLIVWDDANIDQAVEWTIFGAFFNQGEVCVASSRILVHENMYKPFIKKLIDKTKKIQLGNPLKEETEMGPLISKEHLEKIESFIQLGKEEGATLEVGGERIGQKGFYLTPIIFTDVTLEMAIVQEEIFGPFCVIQSFSSEEEAIKLANGTKFGLAAGILSKDLARCERLADRIQAGTIWINSYHTPFVNAPWGGFKQSGIGRELGPQGLAAYSEPKHINLTPKLDKLGWYRF